MKSSFMRILCKHAILILVAAAMMLPFLWMLSTSLKPLLEIDAGNLLPHHWQPENYPGGIPRDRLR